ncbi:MAG: hypothetical protein AAF907_07140, partial [Planctomycetota bacterium]
MLAVGGVLSPAPAAGQVTVNWAEADGDYGVAANWSPALVPDSPARSAVFNVDQTFQVEFDQDYTVDSLSVLSGDVTFTPDATFTADYATVDDVVVEGSTLRLARVTGPGQSGRFNLSVGDELGVAAGGVLEIFDGRTVTTSRLRVGSKNQSGLAGQTGTLVVDGPSSSITTTDPTFVVGVGASFQRGVFRISNNATADFAGSLNIGASSTSGVRGDVDILSGSDVSAAGGLKVVNGSGANQSGDLLIDGAGTTFTTAGPIEIGVGTGFSSGRVAVRNGATLTQTGSDGVAIGGPGGGLSQVTLESGGTITTGAGGTAIAAGGRVEIRGGEFIANGGLVASAGGRLIQQTGGLLSVVGGLLRPNDGQPDGFFEPLPGVRDYVISGPAGPDATGPRRTVAVSCSR